MSGICDTCQRNQDCRRPIDGMDSCRLYVSGKESNYEKLFGSPEKAARTLLESTSECRCCVIREECGYDLDKCVMYDHDALIGWLRGDAEYAEGGAVSKTYIDGGENGSICPISRANVIFEGQKMTFDEEDSEKFAELVRGHFRKLAGLRGDA